MRDRLMLSLDKDFVGDAFDCVCSTLLNEGFEFVHSYKFLKSGSLNREVERNLYKMDGYFAFVDVGVDYDRFDTSNYSQYYVLSVLLIGEECNIEFELYGYYDC